MNTSRSKASVHARRVKACTICGRPQHGNGGAVSHGRGHVRRGEAVELVWERAGRVRRRFVRSTDWALIEDLQRNFGYTRL